MAITYEEAIALDPNTGQVNMDLFQQYADQQKTNLANMRANPPTLSAPLQTLQANPELFNQATSYASSQGVAPGADFQARVEDFAVQSPERQYLMTNPDVLAQATTDYQNRFGNYLPTSEYEEDFARQHYYGTPFTPDFGIQDNRYGFDMALPNVNSGLMNIAKVLTNVEDRNYVGDNADVSRPTYIFNEEISNPSALSDVYGEIGNDFKTNLIGSGASGGMNEDMAGNDMSRFLRNVFAPSNNMGGASMLEDLGGYSELLRAYELLGVTGEGNSYADKQVNSVLNLLNNSDSSLNMDGTGGADAMRANVGTADIGNFSVANAVDAFSNVPPFTPTAAAWKAARVIDSMMYDGMSFPEALDDAMGFSGGNKYTNPPVGFGDESNETGTVGPGFKEGGSTSLKESLQINKPRATPSHPKKSHVVKINDNGQERMIRFGQQGAKTNRNAKQRKAFKDRHAKNIARGQTSPAYWANKVKWKAAEGGLVEYDPAKIAALKESMMDG